MENQKPETGNQKNARPATGARLSALSLRRPDLVRSLPFLISGFWFLVSGLFFSSCITLTPRSQRASASAVVIPDVPMQKWGVESCGAGSLSTVLQHYGDPTSMAAWDATLPKTRGGVLTVDMLIAARQKGFDAQLVTGNRDLVEREIREGRPVILMLQVVEYPGKNYDFFHYVVVDGIDEAHGLVRTQFGDRKGRWTTFNRLEKPWAGGGHAAILIKPRSLEDELRAAVTLEEAGKYADAAAQYRTILSRHPDSSVAWTNLGNAETQLGNQSEAEKAFRQALAVDASSRDALNNLAWLLYQQKRIGDAESFARRAASQPGPDSYVILDTLARILAAKGDCAGAAAQFREALDSIPSGRDAAKAELQKAMSETAASCR